MKLTRNRRPRLLATIIFISFFFSCSEFIEESLVQDEVRLLSPGDNYESLGYDLVFLWNSLPNALEYKLQISAPRFDDAMLFFADTLLEDTRFDISLEPGIYQWRVKAMNGSSSSKYTTRSFIIHEADFTKQRVLLDKPAYGFVSDASEIHFSWQHLYGAEQYTLQIDDNQFYDDNIYKEITLTELTTPVSLKEKKVFHWRVKANNKDKQETSWSDIRSFTVED